MKLPIIVSPVEQEAVRANNGMVTVKVDADNQHVEYVVDGVIRTPEKRLDDGAVLYLYRGTHKLQIFVIRNGQRVNSNVVEFHVLRVHI